MPIETQDLEKKLQKIEQQSGLTAAIVSANAAIQQNNFNKTTKLGTQVGQVTAGYQSLTQEIDDIAPGVWGSQPEQLTVFRGAINPPVVQLTTELPGLKDQVKNKVTQYVATSYADDDYVVDNREVLRSISGVDSSDNGILSGFLKVQITSGEPEAIAYSTKKAVASATPEQVKTVVSNLQNFENKAIELYETSSDDLLDPIVGVATGTVSSLNKATSSVQNISPALSQVSKATIQNLTNFKIPSDELNQAIKLINNNDFNSAASLISKYSASSVQNISSTLSQAASSVQNATSSVQNATSSVQNAVSSVQNIAGDISSTLSQATTQINTTVQQINNTAETIKEAKDFIDNAPVRLESALSKINNGMGKAANDIKKFVDGVNTALDGGLASVVENITESLLGNARRIINGITGLEGVKFDIDEKDLSFVLNLLSANSQSKLGQAAAFLEKWSDLPRNEIIQRLAGIDNKISSNLATAAGSIPVTTRNIDTGIATWDYENTPKDHVFSYVSTHEELEIDLKSIPREITEVVVHWTEHYNNQDVGSEEIQDLLSRAGDSLPYHYLIRKDGSLQRGRPNELLGGALNNNHEIYAIQIAFVGGINAPVGTKDYKKFLSEQSLTPEQIATFQQFCSTAYLAYPGIQILGHNDIDRTQRDPGFDVIQQMEHLFGKVSLFENPDLETPFNRIQLIKAKAP